MISWKKSALAAMCAVALGGLAGCERPGDYGRDDDDLREYPEKPGPMTGDEATGAGDLYDRPAGVGVPGQAPIQEPSRPPIQEPMQPSTQEPMDVDPSVGTGTFEEDIELRERGRQLGEDIEEDIDIDDTMHPGTMPREGEDTPGTRGTTGE